MILDHSKSIMEKHWRKLISSLSRPEIQSFLEKLKRQQEAKLQAQENDNRPFILKYVSSIETKRKIASNRFFCLFFWFSGSIFYLLSSFSFCKAFSQTMLVVRVVVANKMDFVRLFVCLSCVCSLHHLLLFLLFFYANKVKSCSSHHQTSLTANEVVMDNW